MSEPKKDGLLPLIAHLANEKKMEVEVILTVNGIVITGLLIGYQKYYDGIIRLFSQNSKVITKDADISDVKALSSLIEGLELVKEKAISQDKENDDEVSFVHLENAIIINSNEKPPPNYCRIKIDSIDSFMFGGYRPQPDV